MLQDYVTGPMSRTEYTSGEPRSLQEAWAAGDMAVYPYAKSLATKTSISGLVIQKEWVQSLMEPNGEPLSISLCQPCFRSPCRIILVEHDGMMVYAP